MLRIPKNNQRIQHIALRLLSAVGDIGQHSENGCLIAMFFSRDPGAGVTTVTAAVAEALSQRLGTDRVLVIDADPDKRHRRFPGSRTAAVLPTNYGTGGNAAGLQGELPPTGDSPMGAGVLEASGGIGALNAAQLAMLRANLQASFKVVLIDAGALMDGAPLLWRGIVDKRLLIIDARHARTEVLERLAPELRDMGLGPDGFILNKRPFHLPRLFYRFFS